MPSYTYRDGEMVEVPDVVIRESGVLLDDVKSTLVIRPGVSLTTHGTIKGTVQLGNGSTLDARGDVKGTVHVGADAKAVFHRKMGGTLHVERGGEAVLSATAVALGTMQVEGVLVNFGTRGVQVHGRGTVDDREGSTVREPDETWDDGTAVYHG